MEYPPALPDIARWLDQHLRQPPEGFEEGKRKIRNTLVSYLGCSPREAAELFDELEREGYLRYAPEGRSIGGTAGPWIIYLEPEENPEEEECSEEMTTDPELGQRP
jgi:hypothetical protein